MPMAFTEQGVAMLASVLRPKAVIEVNIMKGVSGSYGEGYAEGKAVPGSLRRTKPNQPNKPEGSANMFALPSGQSISLITLLPRVGMPKQPESPQRP